MAGGHWPNLGPSLKQKARNTEGYSISPQDIQARVVRQQASIQAGRLGIVQKGAVPEVAQHARRTVLRSDNHKSV